tara:strand:+ start:2384 stop:4459 length:2076 start_codon:yes stop_codon:yes gene_type:complete
MADMSTWSNPEEQKIAYANYGREALESVGGVQKSTANHYRNFIDIEPNRSVRPGFTANDYYSFRPDEQVSRKYKTAIKMCMDAYDKVGIIRNVIDLMGDFGSQGINLVHENKSAERFFNQWFKKVNGKERSERFLNNLYRTGNVIIYRSNANVTPELSSYMKSLASDIKVDIPNVVKNQIPWRYNFFNPLTINIKDGDMSMFMGRKSLSIKNSLSTKFGEDGIPTDILQTLPANVRNAVERGDRQIPLEAERVRTFYYKKDDWSQWANPMIYAILDDIIMLEKMRLADLSALDGAISNIRLWTIGSLDHKILPNKAAINKLRDILASNVGGGTMELVWGPELSYTESNSQVYKFLGSEKYQSVLNSIYAGLGVPPTLTGMAGNGGGFTNNFISLKTLVERLQYGRDLLVKFWHHELEIVRKAMGFRKGAHIHFDQMSLADETSEKNLLLQLADRDIISHETVLERFKEIAPVEKIRLRREASDRKKDTMPKKAGPYHNPQHDNEIEKIALNKDLLDNEEFLEEKGLPIKEEPVEEPQKDAPSNPEQEPKKEMPQDPGRPLNVIDTEPRKQRVEKPRSVPGLAETILWANKSFDSISNIINSAYLSMNGKSNLRQITKAEVHDLEKMKLDVLYNLEIMSSVDESSVMKILASQKSISKEFKSLLASKNVTLDEMSINDFRSNAVSLFVEFSY